MQQCPELGDFYNSDQKLIAMVHGTIDQFFPNFSRYESLSTKIRLESKNLDLKDLETPLLETAIINDLQEYNLIAVLLRIETCLFDIQLLTLVDSILQSCQELHSKLKEYIIECLEIKHMSPGFKGLLKDNVSIAHERHYAPYKAAWHKIYNESRSLLIKYQDYFNKIIENTEVTSYRLDFLAIMYESKTCVSVLSKHRVDRVMNRFRRLDSIMSKQDKPDTPNAKNFASGLYLNAFQILPHHHVNEIELIKNEYFLKEANKCLSSLLALLSVNDKTAIGEQLIKETNTLSIEEHSETVGLSKTLIIDYINYLENILSELKTLIYENPLQLDKFTNFGVENERLFTFENFLHSAFEKSNNPNSFLLSKAFRDEWNNERDSGCKPEKIENELNYKLLIEHLPSLIKNYFELIMKSMRTLNLSYERLKTKAKDSHFFLRIAILSRQTTEIFFRNQRSAQLCDHFSTYIMEEIFTKNLDVIMKQENDFRLGYLFNSVIYKNNLRYEYFTFLTKTELESSKTFKKVERIAFKENNPLYLIMSFKSMESNLQELFKNFKAASLRDINIIKDDKFGLKTKDLFNLVNENDEYAFFTSDKKHYDTRAPKTLMFFARTTAKTEIFDLVSIYISAIYDAICQCYSYCRNKKIQLARKFEMACMIKPDGSYQTELTQLLDEQTEITEQSIPNLAKLYENMKKAYMSCPIKDICDSFKKEYTSEYSNVLVNALTQTEPSPQIETSQVAPSFLTIEANAGKTKKKQGQTTEEIPSS